MTQKDEKVSEQDTDATQAHPRNLAQDIGVAKVVRFFVIKIIGWVKGEYQLTG